MPQNVPFNASPVGRREQKKRETLQRITDESLRLFLTKGYAETTLDDIAEAAGIARRTFFAYFQSKDDILFAVQDHGIAEAMRPTLLGQPAKLSPLDAMRETFVFLMRTYQRKEAFEIDTLLYSTPELRARKQERYAQMEEYVYAVLCEREGSERKELRLLAMLGVGAFRLAMEPWRRDKGERHLSKYVEETFKALGKML